MHFKQWMAAVCFAGVGTMAVGQQASVSPATATAVEAMVGDILMHGKAYDYDQHLADDIGPRLTGSPNFMKAADWAQGEFRAMGLVNVHTEDWTIPATWEPESVSGKIVTPVDKPLHIYALGWSPSAKVSGPVYVVKSLDSAALEADKDKLHGAVVLLPGASVGPLMGNFEALIAAIEKLRSMSKALVLEGGENGTQAESATGFGGVLSSGPTFQMGKEDFLLLTRLAAKGPVTVEVAQQNRIRKDVKVPQVIAEIRGSELPDEVVIVGGHLDSWEPGTGAQDNGTGVSMVMDTARAMMATHRAPKRTVRFILFSGEEQGLIGSNAYVKSHMAELGKVDAVLVTDSGAEPAKGWAVMGREDERVSMQPIEPLLAGLGGDGMDSSVDEFFGTDHAAFDVHGVPVLVLWTPTEKYDKLHHKASDTFDTVVRKDLTVDTAIVAATAYAIADESGAFAAHLSDAAVKEMLQKTGQTGQYEFMKSHGIMP